MPLQKYSKPEILEELKQQAFALYKTGLTLRKVGKIINRSHQWVKLAVDELEKVPSK